MKLEKIEAKLRKLQPTWVGEKSVPSIIRGLNAAFTKSIVKFTSSRYDQKYYKNHSVIISGQYNPRIFSFLKEQVQIILSFPGAKGKVFISEKEAELLVMRIGKVIHHEYRHKHQQKGRGYAFLKQYKPKFKKHKHATTYYGRFDEVDAYAYETQAENFDINKLRQAHKITWRESEAVYSYRKYFRETDPKVWKTFLKKVYRNNESHFSADKKS